MGQVQFTGRPSDRLGGVWIQTVNQEDDGFEELLEPPNGDGGHFVIRREDSIDIGADDAGMQGDVITLDTEGVTLADQPVADAFTINNQRDRTIEKAAALAHVVYGVVGFGGALGALEIATVASFSSLLSLTNKLADLGEVTGPSDAVAIEVNNDTGGIVLGGKAILKGLEFGKAKMSELDREMRW